MERWFEGCADNYRGRENDLDRSSNIPQSEKKEFSIIQKHTSENIVSSSRGKETRQSRYVVKHSEEGN